MIDILLFQFSLNSDIHHHSVTAPRDAVFCMYFPLISKIDMLCINWTSVVFRGH